MTIGERIERAISVMAEPCHACEGEGTETDRDWDGERYIWFRHECPSCNGTGQQEEEGHGDL